MEVKNSTKHKYWIGVLYLENMRDDWRDVIDDVLQLPYAYCVHNCDVDSMSEHRKDHVHLIVAFPNTTTYNHAFNIMSELSKRNHRALNKIEYCKSIRRCYEYLIHNTDTCKKQGKYLYDSSCRVIGNGFDIGLYEQVSLEDKTKMCKELCDIIVAKHYTNFIDFYTYVTCNMDIAYFDIIRCYSGLYERLMKGNYLKGLNGF